MNTFNISAYAPRMIGLCILALIVSVAEGCHSDTPLPSSLSAPVSSHLPTPSPKLNMQVAHAITEDALMAHVHELAVKIGARPAGSPEEAQALDYVALHLEEWGYHVEYQPFTTTLMTGDAVQSSNVIATRPGSEHWLVVGAHIDSVSDSSGAVDNASGVASLLETAKLLSQLETDHTLVFIGFGAEEYGNPMGSEYYVQSIEKQTDHIVAMLNLDAIGGGRYPYVHAGAEVHLYAPEQGRVSFTGGASWVRDLAIQVADILGNEMRTAPNAYWNGYTGFWSDHYAFVLEDVPVAYFEAWDWHSDVDAPWWGQETLEGDISNTSLDVLEKVIPQQVENITEVVAGTAIAIATHSRFQKAPMHPNAPSPEK